MPLSYRSDSFRPFSSARSVASVVAAILFSLPFAAHAQSSTAAPELTSAQQAEVEAIIKGMTLEQKIDYIGGTGFGLRPVPSVKLPAFEMSDGPVGVRSNSGFPSTTYAGGIGLAASWDRDLAQEIGAGIGRDARARGVHYMLGPGTNIYKSPRNGRNFEYFGEDPFLAGEMVVGYVTGMQQQGVSATVKHYAANNSEYLRHDSDSIVDERALREIYLPAFEAAVKRGHVGAVMDSYNLINGQHATQNGYLNIDVLRKDWGFKGTLMSDWNATYDAVGAANGGLDVEEPTGKFMNKANLLPAIKSGKVSEATIDEKLRHVLYTAEQFNWLGHEQRDPAISTFDSESNETALRSARETPVLLKNSGALLPLNKAEIKTVLVVGPDAYYSSATGGGSAAVTPFHKTSLLEGVAMVAPNVKVLYDAGLPKLSELASQTTFMTTATGGKPGLVHEVFANKTLSGPAKQGTAQHVNNAGLGWDSIADNIDELMASAGGPPKSSSQRFTGFYKAETDGDYLIALAGSGESNGDRVYLDGKLIMDDWSIVRAFEPHLTMHLSAGMHKVVVESWQGWIIGGKLRLAIVRKDKVVNERAKALAAKADVVVIGAGFGTSKDNDSESEGGDRTFDLPYGQDELTRAMSAANPKTIVTVTSGGNVDSTTWIDQVPALVEGWYGGQAGGRGMAEILFGDVNPSGHLPATFERKAEDNPSFANYYPEGDSKRVVYKDGIFVGYRGYEKAGVKPLFPFGFGMSYTTFSFSNLKVTPGATPASATVEFDVTNSGTRKGADVAQVYVSEPNAKVARPAHELKGFERVELAAGETKHVSVPLNARAFAYYDVGKKGWTIDPGQFTIGVGDSLASLSLQGTLQIAPAAVASATF